MRLAIPVYDTEIGRGGEGSTQITQSVNNIVTDLQEREREVQVVKGKVQSLNSDCNFMGPVIPVGGNSAEI